MKIDDEFLRLLSRLNREVSHSLLDGERQFRAEAVFEAQKILNRGAVLKAYSDSKLHANEHRVGVTIDRFMEALVNCDIELDDEAERRILQEIAHATVGSPHLNFPPAIQGQQAAAVQEAYAQEMERLRKRLNEEAANMLREEKIKARSRASAKVQSILATAGVGAGDYPSIHAMMPPQFDAECADFNRDKNSQMAGKISMPIRPSRYTPNDVKREARKLATEEKYKSWRKEYRLLIRSRPGMSDVWYSQKIAKLPVANGSKAETIRRHMKR